MDFLSGLAKSAQDKPAADQPSNAAPPEKHSSGDLYANAKLVAEAAQAQFNNQPEKYDKSKAAAAAADLLDAAEGYGKLDETKGVGKYAEQAEDYLRQYSGGGHKTTAPPAGTAVEIPSDAGGAGDVVKKAEEVVEKPSGDGGEKSGGGYGDLMKSAGSFFK